MADRVLQAAAIRRDLIANVGVRDELHDLVADFASRQAFLDKSKRDAMAREIVRRMSRQWIPESEDVGVRSTTPVLEGMGRKPVESLAGSAKAAMDTFRGKNLAAFRTVLAQEVGTLSGEIEVAFANAARDGIAKKQLLTDLVEADNAARARRAVLNEQVDKLAEAQRAAEKKLATASKRGQKRAKRELSDARKAYTKARAEVNRVKGTGTGSFFDRFETKVAAHSRDAVRRESEAASENAFKQRGVTEFVWIAVNGTDACPSCSERHGLELTSSQAASEGPGRADTYCGSSCMCVLTPKEYTQGNPSLIKPLKSVDIPDLKDTAGRPGKKTFEPIRLGGPNQDIAKEAKKRVEAAKPAGFVPAKTVQDAESFARDRLVRKPIKGRAAEVDYGGVNVSMANTINERLTKHIESGLLKPNSLTRIAPRKEATRALMSTSGQSLFTARAKSTLHVETLAKSIRGRGLSNTGVLYQVEPARAASALVDHEVGHLILDNVHTATQWANPLQKGAKVAIDGWKATVRKLTDNLPSSRAKINIVGGNMEEAFAESFSAINAGTPLDPALRAAAEKVLDVARGM